VDGDAFHDARPGTLAWKKGKTMMTKRFLMTLALGFCGWFAVANAAQAQGYFYGYYYPDEHRFNSPMLNMGVYNYTTITPMWNASHDSQYPYPTRLYSVPTTSPLPTSSAFPSPPPISKSAPAPANIRVVLPQATAKVWFEGHSTQTTGTDRVYQAPPIASGTTYSYHINGVWMEGGRQVEQERTIAVGPGQTAVLDFTQALTAQK
jgi:uncharacterized protein (TIGR03000 family)